MMKHIQHVCFINSRGFKTFYTAVYSKSKLRKRGANHGGDSQREGESQVTEIKGTFRIIKVDVEFITLTLIEAATKYCSEL